MYKITNISNNSVVFSNGEVAKTFWQRFLGLMGRKSISSDYALVFYNASSIHMFFMRIALDLIFLDKKMRVMRIAKNVQPWRMVYCKGAYCTIECGAGKADEKNIKENDQIGVEKI